jgi:hypothetical protein
MVRCRPSAFERDDPADKVYSGYASRCLSDRPLGRLASEV